MLELRGMGIDKFQEEMECQFRLDANPEDIAEFPEAKKLLKQLQKSRRKVNHIIKLRRWILCYD